MEIKRIETYSLYEFCHAIQESVIEGWRFNFKSNELFPTAFGSMLVTGMVRAKSGEVTGAKNLAANAEVNAEVNNKSEVNAEVNAEVNNKSEVKRGRKPKDNT